MLLVNLSILCLAASPGDVVINEIAWMGTAASTSDEWIELYNTTDQGIDLAGWTLSAADGTLNITLSGAISAHGYFLLERTDDTAVNDIPADWTGSFGTGLLNDGDVLTLIDKLANVIDTANGDDGPWPAGSNISSTERYTMERVNPFVSDEDANWATNDPGIARTGRDANSNAINGTPKARNSATNKDPIADAGVDQWVIVGDTTYLDGAGSSDPDGDPLNYDWMFVTRPSGSSASLSATTIVDPTFGADLPGTYIVTLSVGDSYGGTDTDQVVVVAQAPPQAAFTCDPQFPTVWDTVRFTDLSTDIDGTMASWFWRFGDGAVSVDQSPTHGYWYPGTYSVVLKVTDDDGLSDSMTREITVALGPGDITGDGAIDVIDVRLCLQIATGVITGTLEQRAAADVDADGDVDLADAQILADYIIGIRSPLPGGGQP
ncbi:MAG: PKD domain-containing protein [Candidatus Bipolaricaulota bacterium]|nr:PKD domain-containing protein [Candidatus Bipolaricaulota bacterium]